MRLVQLFFIIRKAKLSWKLNFKEFDEKAQLLSQRQLIEFFLSKSEPEYKALLQKNRVILKKEDYRDFHTNL